MKKNIPIISANTKINFDLVSYISLLKKIINTGYTFSSFQNNLKKTVFLRHDIDVSPKLALEMAKAEYKKNISATYFFMLRSPFYNLFSRANNEIVKKIISLGHQIGLHYDLNYKKSKNKAQDKKIEWGRGVTDKLELLIKNEISILEKNFNVSIKAISIHQPSKKILGKKIKIKQINTYEKKFFTDMKYLSDSNMMFKENPIDVIESNKFSKIQLLIHPIWWVAKGTTAKKKWINAIKQNFELEEKSQ